MGEKKAQIWSIDFSTSVVIFLVAVILVVFAWNYMNFQNEGQLAFNRAEKTALSISDILIRTKGNPENWANYSVVTLGLALEEGILNTTKVEMFLDMDYSKARGLLGIANYELWFEINETLNNTWFIVDGKNATFGVFPEENSSLVIPVERYVLLEERPARMRIILWQ